MARLAFRIPLIGYNLSKVPESWCRRGKRSRFAHLTRGEAIEIGCFVICDDLVRKLIGGSIINGWYHLALLPVGQDEAIGRQNEPLPVL